VRTFKPDGLSVTAAETWFDTKAQLCYEYIKAFSANAICKVDEIVFVDLCAGTGLYSSGHNKELFAGAGLRALDPALPITQWILYEQDPGSAEILRQRIRTCFPQKNIIVPEVPRHGLFDHLRDIIPLKGKKRSSRAVLCLADPFSMDLPFSLIRSLASEGCSFLIPFTFMLNSRNNYRFYCDDHADKLKAYLGISDIEAIRSVASNEHFYKKLVQAYQNNMLILGLNTALSVHKLDSVMMQLPAYYVGMFSAQLSTKAIQAEVRASEHLQFELF
jgi:three-Cys-motif partner protein